MKERDTIFLRKITHKVNGQPLKRLVARFAAIDAALLPERKDR